MDPSPPPDTPPAERPRFIGPYRLIGRLGEGGMGIVYEAEQPSPRRHVALKVVRGGAHVDDQRVRLFQREVQTLARLKHPSIAAVYESGHTDDGAHFFAMELVRGEPLDAWVGARGGGAGVSSDLGARLGLFRKICDAVHYAHQRGVIHRDLKPSNILVTREAASGASSPGLPDVKILDFGLARITDGDVAFASVATEAGTIRGTLAYMSPEQIRGNPDEIDARSDIYGLGVVLYEMLTGRLPYDLDATAVHRLPQVILDEPPVPLARAWPGERPPDPDLGTIVAKALEKEPSRRYASAAALSEDLERYLTHQPILARPASTAYQLRKLIQRHKVPFAFATAVAFLAATAALALAVQAGRLARARDRADLEAQKSRRVSDFLEGMFEISNPEENRGQTITAREILDRGAARLSSELADQPEVKATLLQTVGGVYQSLGLYDRAETAARDALRARESALGPDHPDVATALVQMAGVLDASGHHDEATADVERAIAIRTRTFGTDSPELSDALARRALLFEQANHLLEAEADARRAWALAGRLPPADPRREDAARALGVVCARTDKLAEAQDMYGRVLALREARLGATHPAVAVALGDLGRVATQRNDYAAATRYLERALTLREKVLGPDHPDLAVPLENLADLYDDQGRYADARRLGLRSLAIREKSLGPDHRLVGESLAHLAEVDRLLGSLDEAERFARRAIDLFRRVEGPAHPDVAYALNIMGNIEFTRGRLEQALPWHREALAIREKSLGPDHSDTVNSVNNLGVIFQRLKRFDEAEAMQRRALAANTRIYGPEHTMVAFNLNNLGNVLISERKFDEARDALTRSLAMRRKLLGEEHSDVAQTLNNFGQLERFQRHYPEAERFYKEALAMREKLLGPSHPLIASILENYALLCRETGREREAAAMEARIKAIRSK